jgi:hypothetical protein
VVCTGEGGVRPREARGAILQLAVFYWAYQGRAYPSASSDHGVHGPEPAQTVGTAARHVDAPDLPLAANDGVIWAVLADAGAKTGRAKLEGHYEHTAAFSGSHSDFMYRRFGQAPGQPQETKRCSVLGLKFQPRRTSRRSQLAPVAVAAKTSNAASKVHKKATPVKRGKRSPRP